MSLNLGDFVPSAGEVFSGDLAGIGQNFDSPAQIVARIFQVVIAASAAIFVVLILISGVRYLVSAGNEETAGKAKKMLLDSIIGLAIVLAAWGIGVWILSQVGYQLSGGSAAPTAGGGSTEEKTNKNTIAYNQGFIDGVKDGKNNRKLASYSPKVDYSAGEKASYDQGYDAGWQKGLEAYRENPSPPSGGGGQTGGGSTGGGSEKPIKRKNLGTKNIRWDDDEFAQKYVEFKIRCVAIGGVIEELKYINYVRLTCWKYQ